MKNFVLYIDESGIANLANYSTDFFVLTGIAVEKSIDKEISAYFNYIKRRHGFDQDLSLHAYDLFEDKDSPLYFSDNKRCKEFTESISEFVENAPFEIRILYIDKNELRKKLKIPTGYTFRGDQKNKQDKELPYELLGRKLFFEFGKKLKKEKAIGSIIAESRRSADNVLLKTYLDASDPNIFNKNPKMQKISMSVMSHLHSICFAGKRSLHGGLELADIFSYCAYNELAGTFNKKRMDSRGVMEMWSKIKKQIHSAEIAKLTYGQAIQIGEDRINGTTKRIQQRMHAFRDLVNPT